MIALMWAVSRLLLTLALVIKSLMPQVPITVFQSSFGQGWILLLWILKFKKFYTLSAVDQNTYFSTKIIQYHCKIFFPGFEWHTISDLWTISCRWQHKPLTSTQCHKPILILAIFQNYTKLSITDRLYSEKQIRETDRDPSVVVRSS